MEVKTHRTVHECLDTANVCVVQLTLPVEYNVICFLCCDRHQCTLT